ncbi:MAG: radical SAM protein [Bacteroidaceae bacterium]|nr:radical SAM protein [Bacteroidaceae bacterium]
MEQTRLDLATYMSGSISRIMANAYKNVLSNPREEKFAFRMQQLFAKSEKRRKKVQEKEGIDVPPFLISSISTTCNLHCKGCYARSNGIANDQEAERKATMTPQQWQQIFTEAADMGINFSLLAGGEPMMRKDILEAVAEVKDMIFPIFTNGTLIGPSYIEFLRKHLNMVPIISIEGTAMGTDERRGQGVFKRTMQSMELLKQEDLFFGTSITVTTENYQMVTSSEFIDRLRSYGCKIVFYIEYVPTEAGTEHLAFIDEHVAEMGVRQALQSPLFRKIRAARALGWEHTGGCTLFEHREEIEEMISPCLS